MTLRILYALQGFPPNQNGGTEWETHRRAKWLNASGHEARVVAVDRGDPAGGGEATLETGEVDGIPVTRVSIGASAGWDDPREYDDPRIYDAICRVIALDRPDVLHVLSGYRMTTAAIRAGRDHAIPVVLTAMDFWLLCPRVTLQKGTGELCTWPADPMECVTCLANDWRRYRLPHAVTMGASSRTLQRAWRNERLRPSGIAAIQHMVVGRRAALPAALEDVSMVIVASQFLADTLAPRLLPCERLVVMRQGLDMRGWAPAEPTPHQAVHFGYIGQIAEHKGLFDVIAAYRRAATGRVDTRLYIYGDHEGAWPAVREHLLRQIADRPDIHLMGRFDNGAIRGVHANLDVLVVPSRWYENSPNVILEAFACRTPVIASDIGGMAELVADGKGGWLIPPGDIAALCACMTRIADHPEMLDEARDHMPPVRSIDEEMAELVDHYRRVLAA